jgi:hypothetical protein
MASAAGLVLWVQDAGINPLSKYSRQYSSTAIVPSPRRWTGMSAIT